MGRKRRPEGVPKQSGRGGCACRMGAWSRILKVAAEAMDAGRGQSLGLPGPMGAPPHALFFHQWKHPLSSSHRSAAHAAWSAWRDLPLYAIGWLCPLETESGSWFPQSSMTSGGEPGPREVRGIVSKAGWAPRQRLAGSWAGAELTPFREPCGDETAGMPCLAQGLSFGWGEVWRYAHTALHPTVEYQQCHSQKPMPRLGPRPTEIGPREQVGFSSPPS